MCFICRLCSKHIASDSKNKADAMIGALPAACVYIKCLHTHLVASYNIGLGAASSVRLSSEEQRSTGEEKWDNAEHGEPDERLALICNAVCLGC